MTVSAAPAAPPADAADGAPPSGVTRYLQLASAWRSAIASGRWQLGDRLPTVAQLAAQHGVAAVTVRHALQLLANEGLVTSARGRGSFVSGRPAGPDASLRRAINDPNPAARDFRIDLVERRPVDRLPVELLGDSGQAAARYMLLDKRHLQDGQPFCTMQLFVDTTVHARFPPHSDRRRKINGLLLDHAADRLAHYQTSITLAPADAPTAGRLALPFGAPVVRIVRRVLDADAVVVYAGLFFYRGDRFVLDIDMPASAMLGRPDWLAPQPAAPG